MTRFNGALFRVNSWIDFRPVEKSDPRNHTKSIRMKTKTSLIILLVLTPLAISLTVTHGQKRGPAEIDSIARSRVAGGYNVRSFGAKGDGKTVDTPAINAAIETAAAAGGGTVRFPAGTYLSFTIRLNSHIALYLDQGATILADHPRHLDFEWRPLCYPGNGRRQSDNR